MQVAFSCYLVKISMSPEYLSNQMWQTITLTNATQLKYFQQYLLVCYLLVFCIYNSCRVVGRRIYVFSAPCPVGLVVVFPILPLSSSSGQTMKKTPTSTTFYSTCSVKLRFSFQRLLLKYY